MLCGTPDKQMRISNKWSHHQTLLQTYYVRRWFILAYFCSVEEFLMVLACVWIGFTRATILFIENVSQLLCMLICVRTILSMCMYCVCVFVCMYVCVCVDGDVLQEEEEEVDAKDAFFMSLSTKWMWSMQYCRMLSAYLLYIYKILFCGFEIDNNMIYRLV